MASSTSIRLCCLIIILVVSFQAAGAITDAARTTCGNMKMYYKENECCGNASRVIMFPTQSADMIDASTVFYWTKSGLEQIPHAKWAYFSPSDAMYRPYVAAIPWPGDVFTSEHLDAWKKYVSPNAKTAAGLLAHSFVSTTPMPLTVPSVPTLFSEPVQVKESAIDFRLQYQADLAGSRDLAASALKGRLSNPSGRRLREHFYRFPDQCDATGIALEVFLRLMLLDQVEAFFKPEPRLGLFHTLFSDVLRRAPNATEMSIARLYASRYAEGYMHSLENGGYVYPLMQQAIDPQMLAVGLDPMDMNMDPTTAVGLGNIIGKRATEWLNTHDRLKKDMDWVDETMLEKIEDYHSDTKKWSSWAPSLSGAQRFQGLRPGIVTQQTFVTPSLGIFSFLYANEDEFQSLGLESTVPVLDQSDEAYVRRATEFLFEMRDGLSERKKAVAELSNNKITGSVWLIAAFKKVLQQIVGDSPDYQALYDDFSMVTSGCAEYAAIHAAWRHKRTYLAGRPQSVVRRLAARNSSFAAAFPEAANFTSMIAGGDHPEYPSGSSAIYTAFAEAGNQWFAKQFPNSFSATGGLELPKASQVTGTLTITIPKDKFYWIDGPSADVDLTYTSLDEWVQELPMSRVWGGLHFKEAGVAGLALGVKVGQACFNLQERLKAGDNTATYPWVGRNAVDPFNSK